jgi:hypothetical protein
MKATYGLLFLLIIGSPGVSQVKMKKAEGGFLFFENQKNVLFYQSEPKSKNGTYERCNYIHPLWGPNGEVLTEDFPVDHLHQRGVFWAWHQILIGDKRIGDGWEIKDFEQQVNEIEYISNSEGAAVLKTEVVWKSDQWKRLGEKIPYLRENTTITIYPEKSNYRKIDFEIRLLALEENLSIGGSEDEKGYSGFSVRMILPDDVIFSGPGGLIKPEITQVESNGYVNISGSIIANNKKGGIVIADNPENPGYPQKWILREKNSMQNAAFPGNKTISLSRTEALVLKYSLIIYSGKMSNRKIQKIIDL